MSTIQSDLFEFEYERGILSQLLRRSRLYRTSADFKALLEFVIRMRNIAPFNAMLLQIQKPGLRFAASEVDWWVRCKRTVKQGARPLIIMWPFGPFALVYDLVDTEGREPLADDVASAFRATGDVTAPDISRHMRHLESRGIQCRLLDHGDNSAGAIGLVHRGATRKAKSEYRLHINRNHEPPVQFVTLVHELAHLYLGHLGADGFLRIEARRRLPHATRELEAECLAYIVCARNGVRSKSETYLSNFLEHTDVVDIPDIDALMRAAGQIETLLGLAARTRMLPSTKDPADQNQLFERAPVGWVGKIDGSSVPRTGTRP